MRIAHLLATFAVSFCAHGAMSYEPEPQAEPEHAPHPQLEPVFEMARLLHEEPWAARIEATVSESMATSSQPIGTPRSDEMFVWYDPDGPVCLKLGMLRLEVRPGELIAVHVRNWETMYRATHEGFSIADVIREELPPLWCPWLAIALEDGDPTAWPVVGDGRRFDPSTIKPHGGGLGSGPYSMDGYRMLDDHGGVTASMSFVHTRQRAPGMIGTGTFDGKRIDAPSVWMRGYAFSVQRGRTRTTTAFEHEFALPDSWTPIEFEGRSPVGSLADLGPATPQLVAGDRSPVINLSYPDPERNAIRNWKPMDLFMHRVRGTDDRPRAVVLAITRPRGDAALRLEQFSASIEHARRGLDQDQRPIPFAAHPVVATAATEDAMDQLDALGDAWKSARPSSVDPDEGRRGSAIPLISVGPASLLLDRVAPGADAAIVVVDRSGWITGVIGPEVTGDDLVNAITDAVRSAAR